MKIKKKLKKWYWSFLVVSLITFLACRLESINSYGPEIIDIPAGIILTVLLLVPLFSEIELFGFKVKKEPKSERKLLSDKNLKENAEKNESILPKINPSTIIPELDIYEDLMIFVKIRIAIENELRRAWYNKVNYIQGQGKKEKVGIVGFAVDLLKMNFLRIETHEMLVNIATICNNAAHGIKPNETQEKFVLGNYARLLEFLKTI